MDCSALGVEDICADRDASTEQECKNTEDEHGTAGVADEGWRGHRDGLVVSVDDA